MDSNVSESADAMEHSVKIVAVENVQLRASTGIKIATIAVLFVLTAINCTYFFVPGHPNEVVPYAIGSLISPFITSIIVVLIFQIFKGFRNQRSRWKIVLWTNCILLMSKIFHIAQTASTFLTQLAG
jgi:hypothetical protein